MTYLYDGTFDGILCVLNAHYYTEKADGAYVADGYQEAIGDGPVMVIRTEEAVAEKVARAIYRKLGQTVFREAYCAALTEDPERGSKILRYLRICFAKGPRIDSYLAHPWIYPVHELVRTVERQAEKYKGTLRFSEIGHALYAPYEPDADITALLMPYFADRLRNERFILHDLRRSVAGVYMDGKWILRALAGNFLSGRSEREREWEALWRRYFESASIGWRYDPKLQRNNLPLKYRKYMWEFHSLG